MNRWLRMAFAYFFLQWAMTSLALAADSPDALLARSRQVLAKLDGEIRVGGLKEPVQVFRDEWGIPHIYARNQDDLFFAQGFITA